MISKNLNLLAIFMGLHLSGCMQSVVDVKTEKLRIREEVKQELIQDAEKEQARLKEDVVQAINKDPEETRSQEEIREELIQSEKKEKARLKEEVIRAINKDVENIPPIPAPIQVESKDPEKIKTPSKAEAGPTLNKEPVPVLKKEVEKIPAKIVEKDIFENLPGIRFHSQLALEKKQEIRVVDNFTVVVGLGSDNLEVSSNLMDALKSIPIVEASILPKKVWFGDRFIFLQSGGWYSWSRYGPKAVSLSIESINKDGHILIRVPFLQRVQILQKIQTLQASSFEPSADIRSEEVAVKEQSSSENKQEKKVVKVIAKKPYMGEKNPSDKKKNIQTESLSNIKPGVFYRNSLPSNKKEEIKVVDDFTVEVSIGSDGKWVSSTIQDAVRSIPIVDKNAMPDEVKVRESIVFLQRNGSYAWDIDGKTPVRLTPTGVRRNGKILVSLPPALQVSQRQQKTNQTVPLESSLILDQNLGVTAAETPAVSEAIEAKVTGFRSSRFGMTKEEVLNAILDDFGLEAKSVRKSFSNTEKTERFEIIVPDLIPGAGEATVVYMFGYQSKQLHQVHTFWGKPFDPEPSPSRILVATRELSQYFSKRAFVKNTVQKDVQLTKDLILVFKGSDTKGRMVAMTLSNLQTNNSSGQNKNSEASLRLSFIENSTDPDIYKAKP
jgi:hypothetical protein